jgi:hypothetical protein
MSQLTNDPNIRIDSAHCRAICEEVGYRLRQMLKNSPLEYPPHLNLLARLGRRDSDYAPPLVPSFNDIGSGGAVDWTSTPLRKPTG